MSGEEVLDESTTSSFDGKQTSLGMPHEIIVVPHEEIETTNYNQAEPLIVNNYEELVTVADLESNTEGIIEEDNNEEEQVVIVVSDRVLQIEKDDSQTDGVSIVMCNEEIYDPDTTDIITVRHADEVEKVDCYRSKIIEVSDESDGSDSDSSSTVSENESSDDDCVVLPNVDIKADSEKEKRVRARGDLGIQDLPPIEDLEISVEEDKCQEIGTIYCIVDTQVVVQSFKNSRPLDLDTVLFLDRGQRFLGKIFDVLGNIQEPLYAIRFNSPEHIKMKNISKNLPVYCAPQTEYTSFVDTIELLKDKGTDALWHDRYGAPIAECIEFSDDEEEARALRITKMTAPAGSKRGMISSGGADTNDAFVQKMNRKNLELTAKRKKEDEQAAAAAAARNRNHRGIHSAGIQRRMPPHSRNACDSPSFGSPFGEPSFKHHRNNRYHHLIVAEQGISPSSARPMTTAMAVLQGGAPRSINNYLVGGMGDFNFTSHQPPPPPPPFIYSTASAPHSHHHQLPSAQNYLTMYTRPGGVGATSIPTTAPYPPIIPSIMGSLPPPLYSPYSAIPIVPAATVPSLSHPPTLPQHLLFSPPPHHDPAVLPSPPSAPFLPHSMSRSNPAALPMSGPPPSLYNPQFAVLPPHPPPIPGPPTNVCQHSAHNPKDAVATSAGTGSSKRPDRRAPQTPSRLAKDTYYRTPPLI